MKLAEILRRIDERLTALNLCDDAASKLAGARDAIRNMRRAVKEGRNGVSTKTLDKLAKVLETSPAWLMGDSPVDMASVENIEELRAERDRLLDQISIVQDRIRAIQRREIPPRTRRKRVR